MGERVWLGLGSNLGDRLEHLRFAVRMIRQQPGLDLVAASPVYETDFVGAGEQDPYLNACVLVESDLEPGELLATVKAWEIERGRQPQGHMAPRPLDVDILLYGTRKVQEEGLRIPHPRLEERLFVLAPLADVAPEEKIPFSGETARNLCAKIRRKCGQKVRLQAQGIE